jgi:hypothetical protein
MDFEGLVERNVNHMMEKMFGDKDSSLKAITKMNLLYDGQEDTKYQMEKVLTKIKQMNSFEAKCIDQELTLTYDKDGNIIYVDDIGTDETKDEIYNEPESEQNTIVCSNR